MLILAVAQRLLGFLFSYALVILPVGVLAWLFRNYFNNGLHKYPGPLLAQFTNWWRFADVRSRQAQATQIRLHAELGDVVRMGPNMLSFADPRALKDIYGHQKGFKKVGE